MDKDRRQSFWLKSLCYIAIPIMIIIIILNIIVMVFKMQETDFLSAKSFYETDRFVYRYSSELQNINSVIDNDYYTEGYTKFNTEDGDTIYYNIYMLSKIDYVVIDKIQKKVYTNLDITASRDSAKELVEYINGEGKYYWNYKDGNTDTNLEPLKLDSLSYSGSLYRMIQGLSDYEIYTSFNNLKGDDKALAFVYDIANYIEKTPYVFITVVLVILTIIAMLYLIISLGHKKGYDGIYLNWLDKIPLEIIVLILMLFLFWGVDIYVNGISWYGTMETIVVSIITGMFVYVLLAIAATTFVKRFKAHTIIKSTAIYMIFDFTRKFIDDLLSNSKLGSRMILLYGGFLGVIFICIVGAISSGGGFWFAFFFFGSIIFVAYIFFKLLNYFKKIYNIKHAIENIYKGNNEIILNPEELKGELKETAIQINDIAGGFSNAIQESIKSERFKTELITNVSHDIKTPLTSIINYVDLLKQEEIENEKVKEYIEILDSKSQRLKKLTEDLVEASKASSGNVKLSMERINVVELINQATGEFEDKFSEKHLDVIVKRDNDDICIMADNRYIYRVIENLFSNISKYALEGSRVYIDIFSINNNVVVSIKNISKESLNISADELMQRFVRGDKSRTTEGSGLGLSISKSLTEIQNGIFNTQIDGDLFKVEMIFKLV